MIAVAGKKPQTSELTICGWSSVSAVLRHRPEKVKRLFYDVRRSGPLKEALRYLASQKRVYRALRESELARVAGTVHHGGLVAVVEGGSPQRAGPSSVKEWAARRAPVLILDRIGNPYNLGAIVRTAAFFNVPIILWEDHPAQTKFSTTAYRVAEGGMEAIEFFEASRLSRVLHEMRQEYTILGTVARGGSDLSQEPAQRHQDKPIALVLGSEETGLSKATASACTRWVRIQGSDHVDSLNVSAANAVLLYHFFGE